MENLFKQSALSGRKALGNFRIVGFVKSVESFHGDTFVGSMTRLHQFHSANARRYTSTQRIRALDLACASQTRTEASVEYSGTISWVG